MDAFRVLEIKKSVFENNDRQADLLREELNNPMPALHRNQLCNNIS